MRKGIHPENYRLVAFKDMSNDQVFLTKSTVHTRETIEIEGVEYPLYKLEISSASHPYYTGKMKLVDTAGRVDKFMNRYKSHLGRSSAPFAGCVVALGPRKRSLSGAFFLVSWWRLGGLSRGQGICEWRRFHLERFEG